MTTTKTALEVQVGGSHYKDCAIQPVQFIEANKLGFLEGCAIKRLARHDKPTGKGRQDIEKVIHEMELLLELRYGPKPAPAPDDGWIEWTGGQQPVPFNTLVDVRFRDSETKYRCGASEFTWFSDQGAFTIVAYRISTNG